MMRLSTLAQNNRSLGYITQTQALANDLQLQIGSGKKSQSYDGIPRETNRLLELENTGERVQQYLENNNIVELRLTAMEDSVAQIFDVMSDFKTLLVNALNANNAAELNLPTVAQNALDEVNLLLNVQIGGRYLFSGGRTDTPPVDQAGLPPAYVIPSADGDALLPAPGYYMGDQNVPRARADDSLMLVYGATADEIEFERVIRALDIVIKTAPPTDRVMLSHALEVTNQTIDDMADMRTRIGSVRSSIEDINNKHNEFLLFTERTISDIENIDVTEAMTRLNSAQVTLEASYITLTRLSQSTLVNFMR